MDYANASSPAGEPQPALLVQKFYAPRLPVKQVARPRLVQRLQAGLENGRAVSLISAPAGYGKSTLAAEWAAAAERPVAWLSLDDADDDPVRFFAYFVGALQRIDRQIGQALFAQLAAGHLPPPGHLLTTLANDLSAVNRPALCVLDDFQAIQEPVILTTLRELIVLPALPLHLVVVTREDPALPLTRLRAQNHLTEIRAADLRFTPEEAARFLDGAGAATLSAGDVAQLTDRTEGWIAGLQLAALSLREKSEPGEFVAKLSGAHRFILGYLTEEVLAAQTEELQTFLLETSILTQLTGDLCNAVTGRTDSADLLERLLAANLFLIPLDDDGGWYRYHHLFAELLRHRLNRTEPDQLPALHERACSWFEAHGMHAAAVEHALAVRDYARTVTLLERYGWRLLNQGYARQMEGWMGAIPAEWRSQSPRLNLDFGWMYLLRGNFPGVVPYLEQAQSALAQADVPTPELDGECAALEANLLQAQGRIPAAIDAARRALMLTPPDHAQVVGLAALALGGAYRQAGHFDRAVEALRQAVHAAGAAGNLVTEMLAYAHLTLMALQYGRLGFVCDMAERAIRRMEAADTPLPPVVGAIHAALGVVHYERNELETARAYLTRGIELAAISGHNASAIFAHAQLARIWMTEGDLDAAANALQRSIELLAGGAPGWVRPEVIQRQVALLLAAGQTAEAEWQLRQSGVSLEDQVTHQTDAVHLAWLQLLLAQGSEEAQPLAERIIDAAEADARNGTLIQALALGALLPHAALETVQDWLRRALALAKAEGYVRVFLDGGGPMAVRLRQVGEEELAQRISAASPPARDDLVEPLSERELEVLGLMADGLTYAEIGEHLVISINTVRHHVKNIYGKLGVSRQLQALERAREIGLI